jgi:hypothetical protein
VKMTIIINILVLIRSLALIRKLTIVLQKSDIHQDADEFEDYYREQRRRIQYYNHADRIFGGNNSDKDDEKDDEDEFILTFKTAPAPKDKHSRTKFAIVADLGVFDHTKENLRNLTENINDIDFVVLAGDISYANGDHRVWDIFFGMMDEMNFLPKKVKGSMFIRYYILRSCYDILYAHLYFLL